MFRDMDDFGSVVEHDEETGRTVFRSKKNKRYVYERVVVKGGEGGEGGEKVGSKRRRVADVVDEEDESSARKLRPRKS